MLKMFSVFDKAVDAFMPPVFLRSKGEAVRQLQDAVKDENHQFYQHPHSFHLYYLGDYDEGKGQFRCPDIPEPIMGAIECLPDDHHAVTDFTLEKRRLAKEK